MTITEDFIAVILRNTFPSVYQRIYDEVKAAIEAGAYAEGDQFPTEKQVMDEYGVSRVMKDLSM